MELTERTLETELKYNGIIVQVHLDKVELENGKVALREVVKHPGGVTVLPLLEDGTVLCVRQFRYPFQEILLELPAGKLEPGEDPRLAALRELEEEVGAVPGRFDYLGPIYPSPGYSAEVLHLYLARDLTLGALNPDEDEFLQVERIPLAQLYEMAMNGELVDAKSVAGVLRTTYRLEQEEKTNG